MTCLLKPLFCSTIFVQRDLGIIRFTFTQLSLSLTISLSLPLSLSVYIYIYIYLPHTSSRVRSNTKVIFLKRNLTGLNSKFHFSWNGCHTKVKDPYLPLYLPIAGGRIVRFINSQEYFCFAKCKQPRTSFQLGWICPFTTTVIYTPQAIRKIYSYQTNLLLYNKGNDFFVLIIFRELDFII